MILLLQEKKSRHRLKCPKPAAFEPTTSWSLAKCSITVYDRSPHLLSFQDLFNKFKHTVKPIVIQQTCQSLQIVDWSKKFLFPTQMELFVFSFVWSQEAIHLSQSKYIILSSVHVIEQACVKVRVWKCVCASACVEVHVSGCEYKWEWTSVMWVCVWVCMWVWCEC